MPRFPCWEIAPSLRRTWAAKVAFFGEMPTAFPSSRLVNGTGSPGGRSLPYSWGERTHTSPSRETGSLSKRVEPRFLSRLHPLSRRYSSTSSSRTHSRRLGWNSSSPSWYSSGRTEPAVGLRGLLWAGLTSPSSVSQATVFLAGTGYTTVTGLWDRKAWSLGCSRRKERVCTSRMPSGVMASAT